MKINLNEFREMLSNLKTVVKPSLKFDLGGYLFILKDRFQTYNNDSSIVVSHDNSSLCDEFAVEFDAFYKFVKINKGDEIEITTDSNSMIAKIGSSRFVSAKAIGIFSKFSEVNFEMNTDDFESLPKDFLEGLNIAKDFVGTNEEKAQTLYIKVEDDTIEATNNFIICRYWMEDNMGKMFLKYNKIYGILAIAPTEYKTDKTKIIFRNNNCYYVIALVNTKFYSFDGIIDAFDDVDTIKFGDDVLDKIDSADIAIGRNKDAGIYISLDNDKATFISNNDVVSTSSETTIENFVGHERLKGRPDFFKYLFECNKEVKFLGTSRAFAENGRYCIVSALMKEDE